MDISFHVQGSDPVPYIVSFQRHEGAIIAKCTCKHGIYGKTLCKHRKRILDGIADDVASENITQISEVRSWLDGTPAEAILKELLAYENEMEIMKAKVARLKIKLEAALSGG